MRNNAEIGKKRIELYYLTGNIKVGGIRLAERKKSTTAKKRTASPSGRKKSSGTTRSSTTRKRTTSGNTTRNTTKNTTRNTARKSTSTRRKPKKKTSIWNNITIGLSLLILSVILVFALCHMDGILLDGVLQLFGGLIGWGTQISWVMICLSGIIVMCDLQPVRLRVLCMLVFPVLWAALSQCILMEPMTISFTTIIHLWNEGMALRTGGVLGGMLATVLTVLLSATGAKIVIVLLMITMAFVALNTTPIRIYYALANLIAEDTEVLREQDMTVTPAKKRKAQPKQKKKKRESFFVFLRDQRAKRKAKALQAEQEVLEKEVHERELAEAEAEQAEKQADLQREVDKRIERSRRLAEVLPEETTDDLPPWEMDAPPWHTEEEAPPVVQQSAVAEQSAKQPTNQEVHAQVEQEIQGAMGTPMPEYLYPSIDLLKPSPRTSNVGVRAELKESSERLVDTLSSFGIDVKIISIVRGPSVTRFEIQMERGVKVSRLTTLSDDIALALGADSVRIAPIPDKLAIGIEVPNKNVQMVALRDVIGSHNFEQTHANLAVALGKDITGNEQVIDLAKMPHLLIAGTTGSGKSVCINSILLSLLYKSSPEEVRLIMIDPKMVELGNYNGIPHLLIPVVTDPKKASGALSWAVGEMERRYSLFAATGMRELGEYNHMVRMQQEKGDTEEEQSPTGRKLEYLPQIVIVIDELADLMMVAAKEVETSICRIAQKARAAGMHLVVATQRPSADVITGIMKSNIPSRIAFAVASQVESRIILDATGAEKLIGKGDMLYSPIGIGKPVRIQGCFVSTEEIERVISHVKTTSAVEYSQEVMDHIEKQAESENSAGGYNAAEDEDELLPQAITIVVESGQASVSMLQRRLKLGYARAARLVDQMEQRGIVGPFEGSKPRQVLISRDDWMQIQLRQKI